MPPSGQCPVHGRPTAVIDVPARESLPTVVAPPGWTLGPLIAHGGTAVVYGVSRAGEAPAILKSGRWRDNDIHARFAIEAEVLRAIGPPTTPTYLAHGAVDRWPYLLMEHVPGETLAAWMARTGERAGLGLVIAILTRLASALATVHAHGFVHRDLKPENILIGPQGVRLLDFGLAKPLRDARTLTQLGAIAGTVHYLSPEQLQTGARVDERADIYSFGVIAYEMLAGQPPFVGERRAIEYNHRVSRPPSLRERRPLPPALDDLVMACLAKQPAARPQRAEDLAAALSRSVADIGTLRGVGGERAVGQASPVVLAWVEAGDPVTVVRAITEVHGLVVRSHGDGILAAFTALHHDAPLAVALAVCRELTCERCRSVVHASTALVRRSAQGKTTVYGEDVERSARWVPSQPYEGLLLTAAAAALAPGTTRPAPGLAGLFRERDLAEATDPRREPALVGRHALLETLVAAATASPPTLVCVHGEPGVGKSRVLAALVDRLRGLGHEVIAVAGRRRFFGDRPDDERLIAALGGGHDLAEALAEVGARGAIVVIDDVQWASAEVMAHLRAPARAVACVVASPEPLGDDAGAVALEPLSYPDAYALLRERLRPARLIPDILLERLAIRAGGHPGLLVALARDLERRGAIRHHAGSEEGYVAADHLDTLLAAPGPAWVAMRALEDLPPELAPVVRMCAGLGPRFTVDEIAVVVELADLPTRLAWLVRDGIFAERGGLYEFTLPGTQEAIYDHALDERALVHARALRFWLAHRSANVTGWLARVAYHAAGAGETVMATACWTVLAREGYARGDTRYADAILARVVTALGALAPAAIAEAVGRLGA